MRWLVLALFTGAAAFAAAETDVSAPALAERAVAVAAPKPASPPATSPPARAPAPRQVALTLDGDALVLHDADGQAVLRLPPAPVVSYPRHRGEIQAHWETTPDGYRAEGSHPAVKSLVTVTARPDDPRIEVVLTLTYQSAVHVAHESYPLLLGKGVRGEALDRAYQMKPVKRRDKLFIDRWTPRVGAWSTQAGPAFGLIGQDTMQGLWVTAERLTFELDHKLNHEHSVYPACFETYERHRPRDDMSMTLRRAGDVVTYALTLVAGETHPPRLRRWPDGARAAFAIVDHADGANSKNLRALMYGSSKRHRPSRNRRDTQGVVGHGLPLTKTVFSTSYQLKNPYFKKLAHKLAAAGAEIAPHSITPFKDSSRVIAKEMASTFKEFAPLTWVDHQPDTNCEALNNEGGRPGHAKNTVKTLLDAGLRYFWEAPDFRGWRGLNLWRPHRRSERVSFFYPGMSLQKDGQVPWLFRSAWLFLPRDTVTARLQPKKLNALEWAHGMFIAHTYFGATKTAKDEDGRSVFEELDDGTLLLRPAFDEVFGDLAKRRKKGTMFVATMGELGQWMERWAASRLTFDGPTTVRVSVPDTMRPDQAYTLRVADKQDVNVAAGEAVTLPRPVWETDLGIRTR